MRKALGEAEPNLAFSFQLPAPIRGWNARDSVAQMKPGDAIALDNWFPGTTAVSLRAGSTAEATVTAAQNIETLMGLALPDGTYKRFAATSSSIFDITIGGASGVAAGAASSTDGRWEYVQINVGGTAYLWACNGVNNSKVYNSTTGLWVALTGASVPALTGISSTTVTNVSLWKYRLILCEKDSLKFYYGPLNSVGGAFTAFDLGQVFKRGGYLMATANWTVDAGDGPEDRFVAISSEGEVAVYQGTDPSALITFALIGVYRVGKPVGRRCFMQLAGDLGILTEQGLWPLSRALQSSETDKRAALTDRVESAFNEYWKVYGGVSGWSMALLPKGPAVLVNVPLSSTLSYQFVMNVITGAWCRFTGWSAACMLVLDGKFYFAIGNTVKQGWVGTSDGTAAINGLATMAFSPLGGRGRSHKVNLVRPIMTVTGPVTLSLALDKDYYTRDSIQQYLSGGGALATFDAALYDTALWAGATMQAGGWKQVPSPTGSVFSLRMRLFAKGISADWAATDFIVEPAGIL